MSEQTTSKGSRNVISSPESAGGLSPCVSPDGQITDPSGPDRRPASRSASQEKAEARQMNDTYPPNLLDWYGTGAPKCCSENKSQARLSSERLQSHLENGLQKRLNGRGSTIYRTAWKPHVTPLGRLISRLRASGHRITASGHFSGHTILDLPQVGWSTVTASLANKGVRLTEGGIKEAMRSRGPDLAAMACLAGWPTPDAQCFNLGSDLGTTQARRDRLKEKHGNSNGAGVGIATAALMATPARLTVSGEMLIGCSAEMESGGQLNPEHSRWLMGFPAVWGSCGATAMQSIRGRRKRSSKRSKKPEPSVFD